jgi:hypothetical protein
MLIQLPAIYCNRFREFLPLLFRKNLVSEFTLMLFDFFSETDSIATDSAVVVAAHLARASASGSGADDPARAGER